MVIPVRNTATRILHNLAAKVYMSATMRFIPSLPLYYRRRYMPPTEAWPREGVVVPEKLRAYPGVLRIEDEETAAFSAAPLQDLAQVHGTAFTWLRGVAWRSFLPVAPRMWRARFAAMRVNSSTERPNHVVAPAAITTAQLKTKAAGLGISAIGVAEHDERYTFDQWRGATVGDRVIVCVLEQNFESTQAIATPAAEKAALSTYAELMQRAAALAGELQSITGISSARARSFGARRCHPLRRGVRPRPTRSQWSVAHAGSWLAVSLDSH